MKFGTGSNNELTQKYKKVKVQNDMRTSKHIIINKQTSPIFNCVTPVSVLLARQLFVHSLYLYSSVLCNLSTVHSVSDCRD